MILNVVHEHDDFQEQLQIGVEIGLNLILLGQPNVSGPQRA